VPWTNSGLGEASEQGSTGPTVPQVGIGEPQFRVRHWQAFQYRGRIEFYPVFDALPDADEYVQPIECSSSMEVNPGDSDGASGDISPFQHVGSDSFEAPFFPDQESVGSVYSDRWYSNTSCSDGSHSDGSASNASMEVQYWGDGSESPMSASHLSVKSSGAQSEEVVFAGRWADDSPPEEWTMVDNQNWIVFCCMTFDDLFKSVVYNIGNEFWELAMAFGVVSGVASVLEGFSS
jgi:hypothetical protein